MILIKSMVTKMNLNYRKILQKLLLFFILFNLVTMTNQGTSATIQTSTKSHVLAIYDDTTNSKVLSLIQDRELITGEPLNITMTKIDENAKIDNYVNSLQLGKTFTEFWIVTNKLADQPLSNDLITEILNTSLPIFIWTDELYYLNGAIHSNLSIVNCPGETTPYENQIYSLQYTNPNNLTLLLNESATTLQPLSGSLHIADCTLSPQAYKIITLKDNSSSMPLLYQPFYKSNILIAPFDYENSSDSSSTDTLSNFNMFSYNTNSINDKVFKSQSVNNFNSENKIDTTTINFSNFISVFSYSMSSNWSTSGNLISFFSSSNNSTSGSNNVSSSSTPNNNFGFLQTGIQIPNIDPNLAKSIAIGSVAIGLISFIIYLLRKYWLTILLAIMAVFAVFKVPTRKISVMDVYHNETRQNIIDILNYRRGQGETVRNMSRELDIPLPTLLWHLQILEEFELVAKIKVKREIVIIAIEYIEDFDLDLKIFEMTFKSDKAKIFYDFLLNLHEDEVFYMKSVVNHTSWSSRTVVRYISKLLELQIIEQNPLGKGYKITPKYFFRLKDLG